MGVCLSVLLGSLSILTKQCSDNFEYLTLKNHKDFIFCGFSFLSESLLCVLYLLLLSAKPEKA